MKVMYEHITNTQIAVIHIFGPKMFNLIQSNNQQLFTCSLYFHSLCSKCPPLAFMHALVDSATVWWQSRWRTDPAAPILQLNVLATHQLLKSSFCNTFLQHSTYFVRKHFKPFECSPYFYFLAKISPHAFFRAKSHIMGTTHLL